MLVFLFSLTLSCIILSCEKAEIEQAEVTLQVASGKSCVSDAGCAGCPDAYAKAVRIYPKEIADVLKHKPKIIFIELGSINFIPSQKMQLVMKSLKQKYGQQVQVIFYDIMKSDQRKYAEKYDIRMIPTQIFLDGYGKEIIRHEGFLPSDQIEIFFREQGLKTQEIAIR